MLKIVTFLVCIWINLAWVITDTSSFIPVHPLCREKWFAEDLELLNNRNWQNTLAYANGNPIQTLTNPNSPFPYYRYDLTFDNVSLDFLYSIEGPNYPNTSKHWIPQLIRGETVPCNHSDQEFCPQYLAYSFCPTPFSDRDVCQIYCPTKISFATLQLAVRTIPFENCASATNTSQNELIHMKEHVAKFFWVDGDQTKFTYLGMENPEENFPAWFMRLFYPWAYGSHVRNYINYVEKTAHNIS